MDRREEIKTQHEKILRGLELAYERMIEFKKYKKTPLVISKDGKVVEIDPNDAPPRVTYKRG
jgi:hypothetical protein